MANSLTHEERVDECMGFLENLFGNRNVSLPQAELFNRGKSNQSFTEGKTRFSVKPNSVKMESWLNSRIEKSDRGVEIFYSPTPMSGMSGRKKTQALPNSVVHGDADLGLTPEVRRQLIEWGACLVRSGGMITRADGTRGFKYHVYLRITEEISPNEVERLNRGLKHFIQGDKFDVTSLLRLPGTRNHKYPGSPLVRVEKLATKRHTPSALAQMLPVPEGEVIVSGVELTGMKMPEIPADFNPSQFPKVKNTVRVWNQRFDMGDPSMRRYMATLAIVRDCIARGASVDVAYAYAMTCKPLLDKAEEENGYSIQKDIAKTYYRETKTAASGLTVEKLAKEAEATPVIVEDNLPDPPSSSAGNDDSPLEEIVPRAFQGEGPNPYSSRDSRNYLDMSIFTSGDFKPPEPEFFSVAGAFHLLYRGQTHCIFGDSGSGKTWIVLAQVAAELKAGRRVKYIDFENGAMTIGHRLRNVLGVPAELLTPDHFKYMWFNQKPETQAEIEDEAAERHDLVIIDGVDASLAMFQFAMNSATEVRQWYDEFVQKFADEGSTVCLIDHTSKGNRDKVDPRHQEPGGSPAKLAVLTGAAYYVRPEEGRELTPGQRGVVNAYITRKDKDGFLKSKAKKDGHLFDFVIDTQGGATIVEFEVANHDTGSTTPTAPSAPELTDDERMVLQTLADAGKPLKMAELKNQTAKSASIVSTATQALVERGFIDQQTVARGAKENSITSSGLDALSGKSPASEPKAEEKPTVGEVAQEVREWVVQNPEKVDPEILDKINHILDSADDGIEGGGKTLDFSQVKDRPNAGPKRECGRCGEMEHLIRPDEVGYQDGKRLCRSCASESIEAETEWSRDGSERARRIRQNIERGNSSRRTRERS